MAQLFHLEEFEHQNSQTLSKGFAAGAGASPGDGDSVRVTFYEQGYKAGWDDAAAAAGEDQAKIGAELSHNLQDLGFTFHEARSHVIRSMEPLLLALVEKLLPELFAETFAQRILEEIMPLADKAADAPIQVVIAPSNRASLEPILAAATTCPLELVDEPSLGPGQVFLRSGQLEKQVDLESAISAISDAIAAIGQEASGAFANG